MGGAMASRVRIQPRAEEFADRLRALPAQPGVYLMKDRGGEVVYVGKAASLRNRVRSYFQTPYGKEPRVRALVRRIADFEFIVTESVQEALLLENLLIKQRKPFFNARLKDDKTYPYIKIDLSEAFPQVYFTRRIQADGARYFGPFASAGSVRKTMDLLKKLFPYRSCTKTITGTDERACLEFHINRCVAPCTGEADADAYRDVIHQVLRFLEGDSESVERDLQAAMERAAGDMRFERAAVLRDQLRAIASVSERQKVVSNRNEDADVVALAYDKGEAWVELFRVRRGKLIGRDHFVMEGGEAEDESALIEQFVQQFYEASTDVPASLLTQHPIENAEAVAEWLSGKRGKRVAVSSPQRGDKRRLVQMAAANAMEALTQKRIKWLHESDKALRALAELQEELNLPDLPRRIECYDISNIQGTNSVGSMVVFENGRPKTAHYRRFQIKGVGGVDDYASMQEMLRRRFRRLGEARAGGSGGPDAPHPPLPIRGEDAANAAGEGTADASYDRHSRAGGNLAPLEACKAPHPPLPIRGEDAANAAGEGAEDASYDRHSRIGGNPAPFEARKAPHPPLPTRGEDAANAAGEGTEDASYDRHSRIGGNPAPFEARKAPIPPLPTRGEDAANAAGEGTGDDNENSERTTAPGDSFGFTPGLVIIDGGKGHLSAAQQVFLELGVTDVPLCSLAKREEEVFLPHAPEPARLERQSQGLYLLQRVRDEAHRFAVTYHRQRRSRAATRSRLDDAPGVGPKRRRELVRRFGSASGVQSASVEEIASLKGMSRESAERLKAFLGGGE